MNELKSKLKSKVEQLTVFNRSHFNTREDYDNDVEKSTKHLEKLANDHANKQSIEFAEWKDRRFERYANGYKPNAQGKISGFEDRFYTINELLQIFKDKDK